MELNQQLTPTLKQLPLSGVLATLEARHRQAIAEQWADVEFPERLLEHEVEWRAQTTRPAGAMGRAEYHQNFGRLRVAL
jgi:hypothetical protein